MCQFQDEQGAIGLKKGRNEGRSKEKKRKETNRLNGFHLQFGRPCISRTRDLRQSDERLETFQSTS